MTHKRRLVFAAICKTIESQNKELAEVFKKWLIKEVEKGTNAQQRAKELASAVRGTTLGRDTFKCSKRSHDGPLFFCPYGGNSIRCALKRGVDTDPNQTVGSLIVRAAVSVRLHAESIRDAEAVAQEQQERELAVAEFVEDSMGSLPDSSTSVTIVYDDDHRPVSAGLRAGGSASTNLRPRCK